jgi:hypothetical protein
MKNIYGFWISPTSEVYTIFDDFGHKRFIEKLLGKQLDTEANEDTTLFDNGWIRIVNTDNSFMVNYRCITSNDQIKAIRKIEDKLANEGYFHKTFILDYGYDYHFFDSINGLINRIRERL